MPLKSPIGGNPRKEKEKKGKAKNKLVEDLSNYDLDPSSSAQSKMQADLLKDIASHAAAKRQAKQGKSQHVSTNLFCQKYIEKIQMLFDFHELLGSNCFGKLSL